MLSREEIEGELRDVFAKMSPVELERELKGAWRELVEEELANRLEAGRIEASRLEASRGSLLEESRPVESLDAKDAPMTQALLLSTPLPSPPPLRSKLEVTYRGIPARDLEEKAPLTQKPVFASARAGKIAMDQSLEKSYRVSCFGALLEFRWFSFSPPRCEIWSLAWLSCWSSPSRPRWPTWPRDGI